MGDIHERLNCLGFLIEFIEKSIRNEPYPLKAVFLMISYWISLGMSHIHPRLGSQRFIVEIYWKWAISIKGWIAMVFLLNSLRNGIWADLGFFLMISYWIYWEISNKYTRLPSLDFSLHLMGNDLYPLRLDSQGFLIDFDEKWFLNSPNPFPYDFILKSIRNEPYPLKAVFLTISYWISAGRAISIQG